MKRGVVLFAHNNGAIDYYKMAVYTAKRVNKFLDLPVTVITDTNSVSDVSYTFDNTIFVDADTSNMRGNKIWINKGRFRVYDYSPYDETLLLDTDYMINSQQLLATFDYSSDIVCHRDTMTLLNNNPQEHISKISAQSLWATVIRFRRGDRAKQLFQVMEMIQQNYNHYSLIHRFPYYMYRNDYALTLALRIVNGHYDNLSDILSWKLLHIDLQTKVYRENDTTYVAIRNNKPRTDWVRLSNRDFHMLNKANYMELSDD